MQVEVVIYSMNSAPSSIIFQVCHTTYEANNSYCLQYNSCDGSSENLVLDQTEKVLSLDQLNISQLILFFFLNLFLPGFVLTLQEKLCLGQSWELKKLVQERSILIFVAFLNTGDKKNRQSEVRCCSPRNLVDRARLPVTDTWRCDLN